MPARAEPLAAPAATIASDPIWTGTISWAHDAVIEVYGYPQPTDEVHLVNSVSGSADGTETFSSDQTTFTRFYIEYQCWYERKEVVHVNGTRPFLMYGHFIGDLNDSLGSWTFGSQDTESANAFANDGTLTTDETYTPDGCGPNPPEHSTRPWSYVAGYDTDDVHGALNATAFVGQDVVDDGDSNKNGRSTSHSVTTYNLQRPPATCSVDAASAGAPSPGADHARPAMDSKPGALPSGARPAQGDAPVGRGVEPASQLTPDERATKEQRIQELAEQIRQDQHYNDLFRQASYVGGLVTGGCLVQGNPLGFVPAVITAVLLAAAYHFGGRALAAEAERQKLQQELADDSAQPGRNSGGAMPRLLDPNYQQIAAPIPRSLVSQPFTAGDGISPDLADAANAIADTGGQLLGLFDAEVTAVNRAESAYEAGDLTWQDRQTVAAQQYALQESTQIERFESELADVQAALTASHFQAQTNADNGSLLSAQLNTSGLPSWLSDILTRAGQSAAQQEDERQLLIQAPSSIVTSVNGGDLSRLFVDPLVTNPVSGGASFLATFARPLPNVGVAVTPTTASHQLTVHLTAREALCTPNNQLRSIKFTGFDNATVTIPSVGTFNSPSAAPIPIPGQPSSIALTVQKLRAGQPATVSVVVTDGCGDWPTFFGGGPNAF
jgi:hypothetical protein